MKTFRERVMDGEVCSICGDEFEVPRGYRAYCTWCQREARAEHAREDEIEENTDT